jgi:hypothetical protein
MPGLSLVCRRWHGVFWSERSLWRSLTLNVGRLLKLPTAAQREQRRANRLCLEQRVGGMVADVHVRCSLADGWDQAGAAATAAATDTALACLQQLQPGALTQLTLYWGPELPAALLQALPRFGPGLKQLHLRCGKLPAAATSALAQLTQLRWLNCSYTYEEEEEAPDSLPPAAAQALSRLTQLTSLELGQWLGSDAVSSIAEALPHLAGLRELQLCLHSAPDAASQRLIRGIAARSRLTQLILTSWHHKLGSVNCLTQLTGLQQLRLLEWGVAEEGAEASCFPTPAVFAHLQAFDFGSDQSERQFSLPVSPRGCWPGGGGCPGKLVAAGHEAAG